MYIMYECIWYIHTYNPPYHYFCNCNIICRQTQSLQLPIQIFLMENGPLHLLPMQHRLYLIHHDFSWVKPNELIIMKILKIQAMIMPQLLEVGPGVLELERLRTHFVPQHDKYTWKILQVMRMLISLMRLVYWEDSSGLVGDTMCMVWLGHLLILTSQKVNRVYLGCV